MFADISLFMSERKISAVGFVQLQFADPLIGQLPASPQSGEWCLVRKKWCTDKSGVFRQTGKPPSAADFSEATSFKVVIRMGQ